MKQNRQALWNDLQSRGLVQGECPAIQEQDSPWYVRLMLGFAGWIAALFLLGFLGVGMEFVFRTEGVALVFGLVMLGISFVLLKRPTMSDFQVQFALAVSFAGQALIVYGILNLNKFDFQQGSWLAVCLVQTVLAFLMPNSIHRVWSAYFAAIALVLAMYTGHIYFIQASILLALCSFIWLYEFDFRGKVTQMRDIGYGITLALLQLAGSSVAYGVLLKFGHANRLQGWNQPWLGEVLSGMVMLYTVWKILRQHQVRIPSKLATSALLAAVLLAYLSTHAFGLSAGVLIMLLGYHHGNRILTGLGIAALLFYISSYYYSLHATLLYKSGLLLVVGLGILLARWIMTNFVVEKESQHV